MNEVHAGSCHCGAVRMTIPATSVEITQCNCSLCTKLGTRWVYFRPDDVEITGGSLDSYRRTDLKQPGLTTLRCQTCGAVVCWHAIDPGHPRMGVNANLFDQTLIDTLPVKHVNGRDWDG